MGEFMIRALRCGPGNFTLVIRRSTSPSPTSDRKLLGEITTRGLLGERTRTSVLLASRDAISKLENKNLARAKETQTSDLTS